MVANVGPDSLKFLGLEQTYKNALTGRKSHYQPPHREDEAEEER